MKLAEELIAQVEQQQVEKRQTFTVPVIFELSAWKNNQQTIEEWLVAQLKDNYSIDFKISQQWLKHNQILPLLDGLDELGSTRQKLAIKKINEYLHQDIARKLVVCCRREEYQQVQIKLHKLNGAYYLQPPTESDIINYLQRLKQQDLWQKIESNQGMRKLAQKPLFLNFMITAFQGKVIVNEEQLFANYVEEQLKRPIDKKKRYSDEDTKKWLTYLAGQLEADSLTVFLIEKMQSYWLNPGRERWVFRLIFGLIFGLIVGLIVGLTFGLIFELIFGLISGLTFGLIFGLTFGLIFGLTSWEFKEYKIQAEAFYFTWEGVKKGLTFGLIVGLISGPTLGLIVGLIFELIFGLIVGLIFGLIGGLIVGLILNLNVEIKSRDKPNQGIKQSLNKTLIIPLISSPLLMLTHPLISFFTSEPFLWIKFVSIGLIYGLMISLFSGGIDLIQHLTLRLILQKQGLIPRNYDHFLGYASDKKLIQRVGGQYRFLHDSLRKHFASQFADQFPNQKGFLDQKLIPKRVIQKNPWYQKLLGLFLVLAWLYIFLSFFKSLQIYHSMSG